MRRIFLFIAVFLLPLATQATVDFRLNLGRTFSNPDSLNEGLSERLHISGLSNIGFDLLINPLFLPGGLGFGMRFDSFQTAQKDGNDEFSYSGSSFSMLVNYRLINTGFYAGPLIGIGVGNSAKVETVFGSAPKTTYEAGKIRNISFGVEGGARVTSLVFGGEFGYQYYNVKNFMDGNANYLTNSMGTPKEGDLSGLYMKISCGFSF